jgi:hypothetical protein
MCIGEAQVRGARRKEQKRSRPLRLGNSSKSGKQEQ